MRSAALALAFCVIFAGPVAAADAAHPGVLVVDGAGGVLVAAGIADGRIPSIVRIGRGGRVRTVHRFAPNDTPGSLALIGGRVVGLDGYPESAGRAFVIDGDRFRTVFRVPDDGYGSLAYGRAAPAAGGYAFAIDGGRGQSCRPLKGHSPCGAIELIARDGRARRLATFSRSAAPLPIGGDGRSAWFGAYDPARLLVVRDGRVTTVDTGGRYALDATPFGSNALVALRGEGAVYVAALEGIALRTLAALRTDRPDSDATLRARGRVAYALVVSHAGSPGSECRLYLLAPPAAPRLLRRWEGGDWVRLHFVDATGGAVISSETRNVIGTVTTRGELFRIGTNGHVSRLPLGALGERAAVGDAIAAPDGAVWSYLTFYGAPAGVVRSNRQTSVTYRLDEGNGGRLR